MKKKPIYKALYYEPEESSVGVEKQLNEMYEKGYRYIGSIRFTLIFELIPK